MDAARGLKGQGWPFKPAPEAAMEQTNPARSAGPDAGARLFGSFWGDCQKELAQQGETKLSSSSLIAMTATLSFGSH